MAPVSKPPKLTSGGAGVDAPFQETVMQSLPVATGVDEAFHETAMQSLPVARGVDEAFHETAMQSLPVAVGVEEASQFVDPLPGAFPP